MLLNARELGGIAAGQISLVFRRWQRASVKAGTQQRTRIGVVAVDSVDVLEESGLTDTDARAAGHPDLAALLTALNRYGDGAIHRIQLHLAGPDPRISLQERADLTADEVTEIHTRLSQMDGRSSFGPWTQETLRMIAERPGVRAPDLAASVGSPSATSVWSTPPGPSRRQNGMPADVRRGAARRGLAAWLAVGGLAGMVVVAE